jgi:hypothetical protein
MESLNWDRVLAGLGLAWAIATMLWTRYVQSQAAQASEVRKLDDKIDIVERNCAMLEKRVDDLPRKESVHALELMMSSVQGDVRVLSEALKPVANSVRRIDEFLMEAPTGRNSRGTDR